VLSDVADVEYQCSDFYDPGGEAGLRWGDPAVGIEWPIQDPVVSSRDASYPPFGPDRPDFFGSR
jgi:dTDP-4-dehydrorhamnose 3,5-epimerase